MQAKSLKKLQELCAGKFSISLNGIVKNTGVHPLPCGIDIYQGSNDPKKSPQILIKKGVDLKKRQKPLSKFLENSLKSNNKDLPFLANKSGEQLEKIDILINQETIPFFNESAQPMLDKVLKFIDSSDLSSSIHPNYLSQYSKVKSTFTKLMKSQTSTFYLFSIEDCDLLDTFHNAMVAFYSVYIAQILNPDADWIPTLFEAAFFHELGQKPKKECSGEKAISRGQSLTEDVLEKLSDFNIPKPSLALIKSHHKLLVSTEKKGGIAAKILQTVNALDAYTRAGFICINDKIEMCSALNLDKACETLMIKSNPTTNDTCPKPIFDETIVNTILNLFGRNYLIEKERQIRNEILEPCEYTNCQANRVTVSCHNEYFKVSYQQKNKFCMGQGGNINLVNEQGKSTYLPKCNNGCDTMSQINIQYREVSQEEEEN
ncbi:MAG: hypothetical protein COB02_08710 [Candidatus Cloacimonadota bacterium]|nr:MAG: hypothetical protein COB02_08710 [Candidatus Cloacimonadota bacterium]